MKFIDLGRQYELIKESIDGGIKDVLESQSFIMGDRIDELERKLAKYVGRKYCVTCGSGTQALLIPLMMYDLKKTDAVFVPSFTFFASAESINLAGGTPVFVDIDRSFNIDTNSLRSEIEKVIVEKKLTPRGVISVDLFGRSADYDEIIRIVEEYDLFLIEDAAQGFGGRFKGRRNGSFGNVSTTSFFPAKPLGCYGDGGAIFFDDDDMIDVIRSIRIHGQGENKYDNVRIGINGRLDSIQAAILLAKLSVFEDELEMRQRVADWYDKYLCEFVELPIRDDSYYSAWAQYTVMAKDSKERKEIIDELEKNDIPSMIYYPIPLHKQTVYRKMGYNGVSLPYCEEASARVLSLPMYPYITKNEVEMICNVVRSVVGNRS